jgi:hypothetical protein
MSESHFYAMVSILASKTCEPGHAMAGFQRMKRRGTFSGAARGRNTYLYPSVVSCEEIHEEKLQYEYESLLPALASRNSALHLTANSDCRPESLASRSKTAIDTSPVRRYSSGQKQRLFRFPI